MDISITNKSRIKNRIWGILGKNLLNRIIIVLFSFTIFHGCTSSAILRNISTTNFFNNKIKLKIGLFIPSDIKNRSTIIEAATLTCGAWSTEINSGRAYSSAIQSGLSSCIQNLYTANSPIDIEMARIMRFDYYVIPRVIDEKASIIVQEDFYTGLINSKFQTTVILNFFNPGGELVFAYTANGIGVNQESGDCSDMANVTVVSIESSLKQIADNISRDLYNSIQLNNFGQRNSTLRSVE